MCNAFDAGISIHESQWKGGWALEIETFLGPGKWPSHQASAIWARKSREIDP
jgi:hypothetical protein